MSIAVQAPEMIKIHPSTEADLVLEAAADYIEKHGWWQGDCGEGENGEACALVAMGKVLFDAEISARRNDIFFAAVDKLYSHLDFGPPSDTEKMKTSRVISWNDSRSEVQEVTRALRAAASR